MNNIKIGDIINYEDKFLLKNSIYGYVKHNTIIGSGSLSHKFNIKKIIIKEDLII